PAVGEAAPPDPALGAFLAFQRCPFFGRQPVGSFLEVALHRRALIPLRRDSRQGRASQDDGAGGLKRARQQRPQGLTPVHGAHLCFLIEWGEITSGQNKSAGLSRQSVSRRLVAFSGPSRTTLLLLSLGFWGRVPCGTPHGACC